MATIFDRVKQQLSPGLSQDPTATGLGVSKQIGAMQQAATGKAAPLTSGPKEVNLASQLAEGQRQLGEQQLAAQAEETRVKLAAEEETRAQTNLLERRKMGQAELDTWSEFTDNNMALLESYRQGNRQLDLKKDQAVLEQLGFNLRLNDAKYLDTLQREGARSRLMNDYNFKQAMQEAVFTDERELLADSLEFQSMLNADDRKFNEKLSRMSLDMALQMANAQAQQANQEMIWGGIGTMVQGGAKAYASGMFTSTPSTPTQGVGTGPFDVTGGFTPEPTFEPSVANATTQNPFLTGK